MDLPTAPDALYRLARLHGIEESYVDIEGRHWHAPPEALLAILQALGVGLARIEDSPHQLLEDMRALWRRPIDPVCVAWDGHGAVSLRLPEDACGPYVLVATAEDGSRQRAEGDLSDCSVATREDVDGRPHVAVQVALPGPLALGYHRLHLEVGAGRHRLEAAATVLSAPVRAWTPGASVRQWGAFLPVHALHRDEGRGAGNLADLRALMRFVHREGGGVVGTLPMLAAYLDEPFDPSPYSPASRLAWNELFLDVEGAPEYATCAPAQRALSNPDAVRLAARLRGEPLVDYRAQYRMQRAALEAMAEQCERVGGKRRAALEAFIASRPEIEAYARFAAVVDRRRETWPQWPTAQAQGRITEADFDPAAQRYHRYAQFCMHEQLEALARDAPPDGMGLYLDLPVGVGGASFDTWLEHAAGTYMHGLSTGAPPDLLFSGGQNWAFPPLHPERIRDDGYRHVVAILRNHLRYAGVLRIDHVMGLHRLYVIPQGCTAKQGVYLKYRAEELYAILTIESHRHQTLLVGEDLGTVPDVVRETMARHHVMGLHVVQYEAKPHAADTLPPAPAGSVATVNTHDMPPFAAYWDGQDIDDRAALGWLDEDQVAQAKAERGHLRAGLRRFWSRYDALPPDADHRRALLSCLRQLGRSEARLVLVSLEDLWGETKPQNVPGTWREVPNWRRRAQLSLEALQEEPRVLEGLAVLDEARRGHRRSVGPVRHDVTRLSADDLHLWNEGTHRRMYERLGAHPMTVHGQEGTYFAVWAPNATYAAVIGDFNDWDRGAHPLAPHSESGIWEGFIPGALPGTLYKLHIAGPGGWSEDKADPFAFAAELPPRTASVVTDLSYEWHDDEWMAQRARRSAHDAPISIYEVHLGSWMRVPEEENRWLSYRELAPRLAEHVLAMGFTHVELLPVMEHPFYGSWGYQVTGFFAPTSRFGDPQGLMYLIDHLHERGIGVILDWVPSHFPADAHGLAFFDGTHLFEHEDPRQGFHPDWNSLIFNYGRHEVVSFLLSSAVFWLDRFHVDGLRVDGVASMLYLDYSRADGEWVPNEYGGRENLEAIEFLRKLSEATYGSFEGVQTYAEESTAWPMVSRPTHVGGLGFGYKWDMGWMHDTLAYLQRAPVHRSWHQNELTFRMIYAWGENFVLSLSHDEVVHGKGSLLGKMPGDAWQKFANLRLLYAYQWSQPGKKLLFMGQEFGQGPEWDHDSSLHWHQTEDPLHGGVLAWVRDLNAVLRLPAMHQLDHDPHGFAWIDFSDTANCIVTLKRRGRTGGYVVVVFNFTPVARDGYRVGVPAGGWWRERLNSDAEVYGGSGVGNRGGQEAEPVGAHEQPFSLTLSLPPLGALFFVSDASVEAG